MASKFTLSILAVATFSVFHQQATAASISLLGEAAEIDLADRPWVPFKICLKGSDICQNIIATTADGLDFSLLYNGSEPIILNIDEDGEERDDQSGDDSDDKPLSEDDLAQLSSGKLKDMLQLPLDDMSAEEIDNISGADIA